MLQMYWMIPPLACLSFSYRWIGGGWIVGIVVEYEKYKKTALIPEGMNNGMNPE
jgi:hypothetical protein